MKIVLNEFKGIMPKLANDKLPIDMAQIADDLKTASGELVAYKRSTADIALPGNSYQTFFEYLEGGNNHWVYYDLIVHWVRTPIANDAFERMYLTGSDSVNGKYKAFVNDKISGTFDFTTDFYFPGADSGAAPSATGYTTGSQFRAYYYTYVSRYGEEGPPSAVTEVTDFGSGNVTLGNFTEPDAADEHLKVAIGGNRPALRIYRTADDGAGNADFLFVKEAFTDGINWATFTVVDDVANADLGPTNESTFYDRAPNNLSNLRGHPNGFFVAYKGNTLYFSEPFVPHAWPTDYQIAVDQQIISLGIFGSTIVVTTDGDVYTFAGPNPTTLYKTRLDFQPCLSQRGTVETTEGVMFPSAEGFQIVSAAGIRNITAEFFKPEDWDDFELETIHGTWFNKAYYGFYKTAGNEGNIRIDILNNSITTGVDYHQAGHVALVDGKFRTIFNSDITDPETFFISQWDNNPQQYRNYLYRSPRFILQKPQNFKVAQVILDTDFIAELLVLIEESGDLQAANQAAWDAGDALQSPWNGAAFNVQDMNGDTLLSLTSLGVQQFVEFRLYVDSVLKFTKQVFDSNLFKLPRGFKNKKWEVEVTGMIPLKRIIMATSTEEIV